MSKAERPVEAILFDMDGTLIDERESYREAIRRTAEFLLGEPVSADEVAEIKRYPGMNNDWDATWSLIGRRMHGLVVPPSEADRGSYAYRRFRNVFQTYYLGDRLWREFSGEEPPFAAEPLMEREKALVLEETLTRLSRFKLGIATSRPRREALLALRRHGLGRFFREEALVAQEDAPAEKPHPVPLRELARRLNARVAAYVGDTINDALAALQAGMLFVHVGTEPLASAEAERNVRYRVRDVNEILTIFLDRDGAEWES